MRQEGYEIRVKNQLEEWVKGNPQHNHVDDECCPDFSCCQPALLQPIDIRQVFAEADDEKRMGMLGEFLGSAFSSMAGDKKVYIVDGSPEVPKTVSWTQHLVGPFDGIKQRCLLCGETIVDYTNAMCSDGHVPCGWAEGYLYVGGKNPTVFLTTKPERDIDVVGMCNIFE